jgi:formamidopyrimidine-DNA glycosylase
MPEIVEVKKYVDFLLSKFKNKSIINISILRGRYKNHEPFDNYHLIKKNLPLRVLDVLSKGKLIYIILEDNYYILNTLGLFGGWIYYSNKRDKYQFEEMRDYIEQDKLDNYFNNTIKHLNIELKLSDENSLYFYDMLSFGTFKVITSQDELDKKLKTLGPDIMDLDTDYNLFLERLRKYDDKKIGIVLMNQKCISGIGNYLRADILWLSKINPFRLVKKLSDDEIYKIYYNSRLLTYGDYDRDKAIILGIIKKKDKIPKDYERDFFVYDQEYDIYNNKVIKEELYDGSQKRFIYYVKKYQV